MKNIRITLQKDMVFYALKKENNQHYVTHHFTEEYVDNCWILSVDTKEGKSYHIAADTPFHVKRMDGRETEVSITGREGVTVHEFCGCPCADIFGNRIELDIRNGKLFEKAIAGFYWKTLLPCVIEQTKALKYPDREGYVISTLQEHVYAGTYPDVDHEFQVKGRLAMGNWLDMDIIRRMLELQLRVMEEDPEGAYRDPCAIQPSGVREYHVRRNSMDGKTNAEMFLITGNVEIIELIWYYIAVTKDFGWLEKHMEGMEGALSLVADCMDRYGRLWSDVYYEDQVIKDGRECMSAALAAHSFKLMAELERRLGREKKAVYYTELERRLAGNMIAQTPAGFWDKEAGRFVDWIDRDSVIHDHIHLLANELPLLFQYADTAQKAAVDGMIAEHFDEFQRFPSFMSARIQDYTDSEIGDGGPYDLCAAGRYWCWDFAYWHAKGRKDVLENQLLAVCGQARQDGYYMGERYDMNHIYYISERSWHGAANYYEYPCVFLWNMITGYVGVKPSMEADLKLEPMLQGEGRVRLENPIWGIEYEYRKESFSIQNLLDEQRCVELDIRKLAGRENTLFVGGEEAAGQQLKLSLKPQEKITIQISGCGKKAAD